MDHTLIEQLQKCHSFLLKLEEKIKGMSELSSQKTGFDIELSKLQKQQTPTNLKVERNGYFKLLFAFLFAPAIVLSCYLVVALNNNTYNPSRTTFFGVIFLTVFLDLAVSIFIASFFASKKSRKRADRIAVLDSMISTIREKQDILENEVYSLLESQDAELVEELIPPDYREAFAVERFIYFFRNGHVESMKEAVREYDTYIHNITMEAAAEQSATAAAESALQAARTAKNVEEIQFWTMLNTFINASRK